MASKQSFFFFDKYVEFIKKRKGVTQVNNKYTREKSNQKNKKKS
jgi:hypothetical protein